MKQVQPRSLSEPYASLEEYDAGKDLERDTYQAATQNMDTSWDQNLTVHESAAQLVSIVMSLEEERDGLTSHPKGGSGRCEDHEAGLFLHVSRAGGGYVLSRAADKKLCVIQCHPYPCPEMLLKTNRVIIPIRDPVERFYSAFHWQMETWNCENLQERRKYCDLYSQFDLKASTYAEELCKPDSRASHNWENGRLKWLGHAQITLTHWLPLRLMSKLPELQITAVVQERDFDFDSQVEAALDWLSDYVSKIQTKYFQNIPENMEEDLYHASHWQDTDFITEMSRCCLSRRLRDDYLLLRSMRSALCQAYESNLANHATCMDAIGSILERNKNGWDGQDPCEELTEHFFD